MFDQIRPYFGAIQIGAGIGALYLYARTYTGLLQYDDEMRQKGAKTQVLVYWMLGWSVMHILVSQGWTSMFFQNYTSIQQKKIIKIMWQDRIMAVFISVVVRVLHRGGTLGKGNPFGVFVGYALPIVSLWTQTQCKVLTHLNVGSPFHPTWWSNGDVPKYSRNEWMNLSFSLVTTLLTAVSTSLAFYAIATTVGFDSLSMDAKHVWKFAAVQGILFVFSSGIWMIVASVGVPAVGKSKAFKVLAIPPLLRANPYDCIPVHKRDLLVGNGLLLLATFVPDEYLEPNRLAIMYATFAAWVVSISGKIYVHIVGWGYTSPYDNEPQMDAAEASSSASKDPAKES